MTHKQLDRLFQLIMLFLTMSAVFGVYHFFWLSDGWLERVIVFFAYTTGIYLVFMLTVFGLAGLGNNLERAERHWSNDDHSSSAQR